MKHKLIVLACTLLVGLLLILGKSSYDNYYSIQVASHSQQYLLSQKEIIAEKAKEQSTIFQAVQKQCQADLKLFNAIPEASRAKYSGPTCTQ